MARTGGTGTVLDEGRELFAALRWRRCVERLAEADAQEPLDGDCLALLGHAAYLTGGDEQSATAFARAYQRFLEAGDVRAATRSAAWASLTLENAREPVRSRAWAARAERLVADHGLDGSEAAWILAFRAHEQLMAQRLDEAAAIAQE